MEISDKTDNIKEERRGDVLVYRLKGRLDAVSAHVVEKSIFDAVDAGCNKVLIDLSLVTYLSSAGIRMCLATTKKLRSLSGRLLICRTASNVLEVFKMSGFDHVLELFETEDEALRNF